MATVKTTDKTTERKNHANKDRDLKDKDSITRESVNLSQIKSNGMSRVSLTLSDQISTDHTKNGNGLIHVGIIPDGNRRWCKSNGHGIFDILKMIIGLIKSTVVNFKNGECSNLDRIGCMSIYILSMDNLTKRNDGTLELIRAGIKILLTDPVLEDVLKIAKFQFVGDLDKVPQDIRESCEILTERTKNNEFSVIGAVGYDPIEDCRKVVTKDPTRVEQSNIDLVIRTGGEFRSSGFFPMHTLYSEWIYLSKFFPDFNLVDLNEAIGTYLQRNRRFGE